MQENVMKNLGHTEMLNFTSDIKCLETFISKTDPK